MDARIEIRRTNLDPKCLTCGWWRGADMTAGPCDRHGIKTLDLAVCGDWRDGDVVQELLPPEKDE